MKIQRLLRESRKPIENLSQNGEIYGTPVMNKTEFDFLDVI